jgi:predicted DNA-binding transcriptional regulator AlpA
MADTENPSPDKAKPGLLEYWITRAELALEFGLSVDTLARWETRRIGPTCVRIGRKVIYRRGAIQEWLREQERPRVGSGGRK